MKITVKELKEHLNGNPLVVETTTAGALKTKLNEMRGGFGLGQGFKKESEEVYEITDAEDYKKKSKSKDFDRKVHKKGGMMLGQGFKLTEQALKDLNLSQEGLVSLIEGIVTELKKNNEYKNLAFVDRIATKYQMNESHINEMKNIIWEKNSPSTGKKLYSYIMECGCQYAQNKFGGYQGLSQPYQSMMPQIKRAFNQNRGQMAAPKAIAVTAKDLSLPMEMVQEMYEIQKEAYKMKMEGSDMDKSHVEEQLMECYERYQGMGEGNMDEMYNEMANMMEYPMAEMMEDDMDLDYDENEEGLLYDDDEEIEEVHSSMDNLYTQSDEEYVFEDDMEEVHSSLDNLYTQSDEELVFEDDLEEVFQDFPKLRKQKINPKYNEKDTDMSDFARTSVSMDDPEGFNINLDDAPEFDFDMPDPEEMDYGYDDIFSEMEGMLKEIDLDGDGDEDMMWDEPEDNEMQVDGTWYQVNQKSPTTFEVKDDEWNDVMVKYDNGVLQVQGNADLPAEVRQYIIDKATGGDVEPVIGEKLDAVGKEDSDVNNDGKKNKTDDYIMAKRSAIAKSMSDKKK